MKLFAQLLWVKKVAMWEKQKVERTTWYVFWWISPIWQKKKLKTFIDEKVKEFDTIYISAWNKWKEVEINPYDLSKLLDAKFVRIAK